MKASTGKRRRVLIIVENLPVPFDRRVWSEATTLAQNGFDVSVVSPALKDYETPYEVVDGVHIYRHPLLQSDDTAFGYLKEYASALYWQFRLALRVRRERGFDVIHACNPPDLMFTVAAFFKLFFRTKFVFDHHDLSPELYESKFERRDIFWAALKLFERLTFATADVSIATNDSYRQVAIERGRMREENVFVVRSGPNLKKLQIQAPKEELKKGADHLIGYVGVIGRQEGLDLLIEAARSVIAERGRGTTHFAIVGAGPKLDAMKALAEERGVADHFTFYGRASDDVLLDVLNTADICVNPDRATEMNDKSTMNKIMEYMALGKPIVQFDLYEGRQSAGGASLYARRDDPEDFAKKICQLIVQKGKRERMGALGRERVATRLSWEHSVPHLLHAYERVFEKRTSRSIDAAKAVVAAAASTRVEASQ
ncbi:MAG: glycosyltransferase family 4 protein [Parvularculaceae bacterium]